MMNPNPFVALNHLTVPLAITLSPLRNRAPCAVFEQPGLLDILMAPDRRIARGGKRGKASQSTIAMLSWRRKPGLCQRSLRDVYDVRSNRCKTNPIIRFGETLAQY